MNELPRLNYAGSDSDTDVIKFVTDKGHEGEITEYGATVFDDVEKPGSQELPNSDPQEPPVRGAEYDAKRDDWKRSGADVYGRRGQVPKDKK